MEAATTYFAEGGPQHTDQTLELAHRRAQALEIREIVVASYTGVTGLKVVQRFDNHNVTVVGGVVGFREPNQVAMDSENRMAIEAAGGKVEEFNRSIKIKVKEQ